jgi:uronate dehydrogenase
LLRTNIDGTSTVLEAARHAGVGRVILASSNHVVGYHPLTDEALPDDLPPRPDTLYGVSKAATEVLGSLYHDRYGLTVLCIRIGTCTTRPHNRRSLRTWLSPDDCARLIEALLTTPNPGYRIVWGQSANTHPAFSLTEARALGYHPHDNAQEYAEAVLAADPGPEPRYVGGAFAE